MGSTSRDREAAAQKRFDRGFWFLYPAVPMLMLCIISFAQGERLLAVVVAVPVLVLAALSIRAMRRASR